MELQKHELLIKPEWIDHNGHMNVAYYVLAFDVVTDAIYETWRIGEDYPQASGCSVFTLGMDVDYLAELFTGDRVYVTTQLLDWDHKRIHYYHRMYKADNDQPVANNECLAMNIHLETRKSVAFPDNVQDVLSSTFEAHRQLEQPAKSALRLGIRRK